MVEVKFSLVKRDFVWMGLIVVLLGVALTYAYTTDGSGNPTVMGHSGAEIEVDDAFCARITGHACGDGVPINLYAEKRCYDGDVYWYDENGDLSFRAEECDDCYEGACVECHYRYGSSPDYYWKEDIWYGTYDSIYWNDVRIAAEDISNDYIYGGYRYTKRGNVKDTQDSYGVHFWDFYEVCRSRIV